MLMLAFSMRLRGTTMLSRFIQLACFCVALGASGWSSALDASSARTLASGDTDARIQSLNGQVTGLLAAPAPEPQALQRLREFLIALQEDRVKVAGERVIVLRDDKALDLEGRPLGVIPEGAEDVVNNNRMRAALDAGLAAFTLFDGTPKERAAAAKALLDEPDEAFSGVIEKALAIEPEPSIKAILEQAFAAGLLGSADAGKRLKAAQALANSTSASIKPLINERLANETDAQVKNALEAALRSIDAKLVWSQRAAAAFSGISLGSILLLVALGLAITYGLMGVINMAHGELMMIGAYATYWVQTLFRTYLPGSFDAYLIAAIPVSFLAAALVGALMERTVIRFLYGRPLETLLATWGISLVLMQTVRTVFGAQNVTVENPVWMSGSVAITSTLSLPINRLLILAFAVLVLIGMWLIIGRTRLGLFVRGVTQNRSMASCMGVNTARTDTYAFALGSGIAGLAGCALSQIGNVGPDLGQSYIVDAFMVVVLGGVGQLAGTVLAALGLGVVNKLIEGWAGAVLAKIAVLLFIVIFIQKRPSGLFALKGRSAEA
jgi:urea transport system permease protein